MTGESLTFHELSLERETRSDRPVLRCGSRAPRATRHERAQRAPPRTRSVVVRRTTGAARAHRPARRLSHVHHTRRHRTKVTSTVCVRARDAASDVLEGEARRAVLLVTDVLIAPGVALELAQRWQQLSGAAMAKGVEDTATYRYSGLLSHAEVGRRSRSRQFVARQRSTSSCESANKGPPHSTPPRHMTPSAQRTPERVSSSLSELPDEWGTLVTRWHRRYRTSPPRSGPDAHDQIVICQSLLALWPIGGTQPPRRTIQRVQHYIVKAAREAKRRTCWTDPDVGYERSLQTWVSTLARDPQFGKEMSHFVERIAPSAATNSLAMTVLKCVAPGVPDFYQGSELWDYSLTDPDNRRPVDFAVRRAALDRLPGAHSTPAQRRSATRRLLARWPHGHLKLYVTREMLALRRQRGDLFSHGTYDALNSSGRLADHVVAIARQQDASYALAVVARQSIARRRTWALRDGTARVGLADRSPPALHGADALSRHLFWHHPERSARSPLCGRLSRGPSGRGARC